MGTHTNPVHCEAKLNTVLSSAMLKCVLLSLGLLAVHSLPLEVETQPSVGQDIIEDVTDDNTVAELEEVVTEETAHSQEAVDDEEITNILETYEGPIKSSDDFYEEHSFVLEYDSELPEEPDFKEMEDADVEDMVITERKLDAPNTTAWPSHFTHRGHSYWFSEEEPGYAGVKVDWLEARNICRRHCMDLVSIETPSEHNIIASFLTERDLPYTWTSGRLCNFKGCDREDLQPINVAGWFWSGSGVRIAPTNSTPPFWQFQPWSHTGHKSQFFAQDIPQPDNAEEEINGSTEACLAVFNDVYDDGVAWHDAACYHKKMFLCEDVEEFLVESSS